MQKVLFLLAYFWEPF